MARLGCVPLGRLPESPSALDTFEFQNCDVKRPLSTLSSRSRCDHKDRHPVLWSSGKLRGQQGRLQTLNKAPVPDKPISHGPLSKQKAESGGGERPC